MIWAMIFSLIFSLLNGGDVHDKDIKMLKREVRETVEDSGRRKEAISYIRDMDQALHGSSDIRTKLYQRYTRFLLDERDIEDLRSDLDGLLMDLDTHRNELLTAREGLYNVLTDEEWNAAFSSWKTVYDPDIGSQ